jgi:hypothetical protein
VSTTFLKPALKATSFNGVERHALARAGRRSCELHDTGQ